MVTATLHFSTADIERIQQGLRFSIGCRLLAAGPGQGDLVFRFVSRVVPEGDLALLGHELPITFTRTLWASDLEKEGRGYAELRLVNLEKVKRGR